MSQFEQIELEDGSQGFRKSLSQGESSCFLAEANGLAAMAATGTVRTPRVLQVDETQLITRWLESLRPSTPAWEELGRSMAQMHSGQVDGFGFEEDNFCGATPQPNPPYADGYLFFAEQRLLYQGHLALERGLLRSGDIDDLEAICRRLPERVPEQAPALLHGDLWSGNVMFCSDGPYLIDPACYQGWPEADLAMTTLFGRFDDSFYRAYREQRELAPDFEARLPIYNLYHLLNHLNLFGRTYHGEVMSILRQFR